MSNWLLKISHSTLIAKIELHIAHYRVPPGTICQADTFMLAEHFRA